MTTPEQSDHHTQTAERDKAVSEELCRVLAQTHPTLQEAKSELDMRPCAD